MRWLASSSSLRNIPETRPLIVIGIVQTGLLQVRLTPKDRYSQSSGLNRPLGSYSEENRLAQTGAYGS